MGNFLVFFGSGILVGAIAMFVICAIQLSKEDDDEE